MSTSQSRQEAVARLSSNAWLQLPDYAAPPRTAHDLSGDQPTRSLSAEAQAFAVNALENGETHYADVPGITPLREKAAAWQNAVLGHERYSGDHILVTASLQEARFLSLQILGELFGGVALAEVAHPGVLKAAATRALKVTRVPVSETLGLLPEPQAWQAALDAGARLLFIESPSRLTGAAYAEDDLRAISAAAKAYDAAIIWDQGLAPWLPAAERQASVAAFGASERVAVLGELWPGLGLESWRIGYIAAPTAWIEAMRVQKQIMSICTNTAVQYAALQVAESFEPFVRATQPGLASLREQLVEQVAHGPVQVLPGAAATIVAVRVPDMAQALSDLDKADYAVAEGTAFGAPGLLRIAILSDGGHLAAANALWRRSERGATQ